MFPGPKPGLFGAPGASDVMLAEEILSSLQILPLDTLRIHEQTIAENERNLRENMLNLGRLVDPIIVEGKNHVVLDGNHRRAVLASLKTEYAVCQVVDYDSPSIRVGGWYLATKSLPLERMGRAEAVDSGAGQAALDRMDAAFVLVRRNNGSDSFSLLPSSGRQLKTVLEDQSRFLGMLKGGAPGAHAGAGSAAGHAANGGSSSVAEENGNGQDLHFIEDSRLDYFLDRGYSVLMRRVFTKEEIIREAVADRPLPPKSTRHMIPNRIIRLNFHLGYLNEPPDAAWHYLTEQVRKRVRYGSARYYTESVIVLY